MPAMPSQEISTAKPTPLQPLPTVDQPNQQIHIDLFGSLKTQGNKMVLVMTDAFSKYSEAIAIPGKQAETVAMEIFIHWICRFGSPVQINSDNGTEFVNKLTKELFKLLDIKHSTTTPGHPQCNAQAEVFNKTMAKYLDSFVDGSTLDWEQYLLALQFFYNTSYHSTIAPTPFELLYGIKPRTPSIWGQDIQRKFYGESFAAERLQILQKARQIAKEHIDEKQKEYKIQHNRKARPHNFSIGQQVLYAQTDFVGKNKKLAPKYIGQATIVEVMTLWLN
jgi:transposase InsO family protein